jgi:hypothetical protein
MKRPLRDLIFYCDRPSDSVRELSRRLNARRLFGGARRRLRSTSGALLVNYGTSHAPGWEVGPKSIVLNPPDKVVNAISKVKAHEYFLQHGVPCLECTTEIGLATKWVQEGSGVLCRRDGLSGGRGIVFIPKGSPDPLPKSDFYTKYFPKTHEYRAHVFRGRLIDLTQKRLKNGAKKDENATAEAKIVRSLDNGWVHTHEALDLPGTRRARLEEVACAAVSALGLDFGAVDILLYTPDKGPRKGTDVVAVAEVNTAPGLGNEVTLKAYEDAIQELYSNTADSRRVPIPVRRRKIKRSVLVWITTKKGNRVQRYRDRWVYADTGELVKKKVP